MFDANQPKKERFSFLTCLFSTGKKFSVAKKQEEKVTDRNPFAVKKVNKNFPFASSEGVLINFVSKKSINRSVFAKEKVSA